MSGSKGAFDLPNKSTDALAREIGEVDLDDLVRAKRMKELDAQDQRVPQDQTK